MKRNLKIPLLYSIITFIIFLGLIRCTDKKHINNNYYQQEVLAIDSLNSISFESGNLQVENSKKIALETLERAIMIDYRKGIANAYRNLGIIYRWEGEYLESLNSLQSSLNFSEQINDEEGILKTYNNLGILYKELGDFDQAVVYYEKLIKSQYIIKDSILLGKVKINIANIELEKGNYNKAVDLYNESLKIFEHLKDTSNILPIYLNLGETYRKLENMDKASDYFKKCEELSEATNKRADLMHTYYYTGELLLYNNQVKEAFPYLEKALILANELNRPQNIKEAAYQLRIYCEKTNDLAKAMIFQKIKEDAEIVLNQTESNRALFNYKFNEQKAISDLKIETRTRLSYISIAAFFGSLLILFAFYRSYKHKKEANRLLTEMDELKNKLYSNITHELRTPLTLILGPLEQMLSSETEKKPSRKQVKMMRKNANTLLNLVNQMLDLSKIDAKNIKLELVEEDINKFLRTRFAAFASLAEQKSITYNCSLLSEKNIRIFDASKLEKIINNLLSNAIKFTPKNGKIGCYANLLHPNTLELIVQDNGKGIPKEELKLIFDRFHQVKNDDDFSNIGTGIGLSLTHELCELMHGKIEVKSEVGKGTEFKVTLPLGTEHLVSDEFQMIKNMNSKNNVNMEFIVNVDTPEDCETIQKSDKEKQNLPHVLVVEDNSDIRKFIVENLADSFNVDQAKNGKAGLKRAISNIPDLVITDIMMPKMDGIEMCNLLKSDEKTSHIPVIILTGKSSFDDRLEGLETGADAYLTKPFHIKELRLQVKKLIEQRQKLRERYTHDLRLEPKDIAVTSVDEKFINRAMEIIEKNIGNSEFEVRQFQEEMFMSRMQLFRKIKALTNQTPGEFIRTIRLKRAASLIKQNFGNIAQITFEVGFNNPSYFAKCFKELFGELPSDYIKNHQLSN